MAGHPTDADREAAARPVLDAVLAASAAADGDALAALYDEDASWLGPEGTARGRDAAAERHLVIATRATGWSEPQQKGAHAVLRWARVAADGSEEERGAIVVEVRRERIILAATA